MFSHLISTYLHCPAPNSHFVLSLFFSQVGDKGNKPYKSAIQSVEELAKQNMEMLQKMRLEITKNPAAPATHLHSPGGGHASSNDQQISSLSHLYTKKLVVEHAQLNEKAAPFECKGVVEPTLNLMVKFDQRNVLRAMGPEPTDYDSFMSSGIVKPNSRDG